MTIADTAAAGGRLQTRAAEAPPQWSSRTAFVAAAVGSAVGLGNIWKFPYMAGVSGGGAFVLMYIGFVAVVGVPVLIAELLMGRHGGPGIVRSLGRIAAGARGGQAWNILGWFVALTALGVLSFYSVVAGGALAYAARAAVGARAATTALASTAAFDTLLTDPAQMIAWHTLVMGAVAAIVARGVNGGIERAMRWLMPMLTLLLAGLAVYAGLVGDFGRAVEFLFRPDLSAITPGTAMAAAGHAFFTLSLGLGAMMVYGAYVPKDVSIPQAAVWVAVADTACALLAGLAIFPLVFGFGLDPAAGPGLIFVTLPVAFAAMPAGGVVATLFFLLIVVAALTSAVALVEPMAAALAGDAEGRRSWTLGLAFGAWVLGLASVFSFNVWSDVRVFDRSVFDFISHVTGDLALPLGGLGAAVFAGWIASRALTAADFASPMLHRAWLTLVRYVAPAVLLLVFLDLLR